MVITMARKRLRTNQSIHQYNLRSRSVQISQTVKIDCNLTQSNNDNACEQIDLPSRLTPLRVYQTVTPQISTLKLTKMPNKCYNLRPKRRLGSSLQSSINNEPKYQSTVEISQLPDDCLMLIFENLDSIRDKCYVEKVCKRFKALIGRLLKAQQTLTVNTAFGSNSNDKFRGFLNKDNWGSIIKKCPNLKQFKLPGFYTREKKLSDFMGERFGDYEMELLSKTTDLKEVDICGCGDVTERGLDFVISNCRKLEKLSISFCCQITGLSLDKLSHNFKQLSLNGNELTPFLDNSLKSLCQGEGKYLTDLSICWYDSLQTHESVLDMICSKFVHLKVFRWSVSSKVPGCLGIVGNLSGLTDIAFDTDSSSLDDKAFIKIMCGCPKLKNIFIRIETRIDQVGFTDYSLRKLPTYCPQIEKITLISKTGVIKSITDSSIISLANLKNLESLILKSFEHVGDSIINVIKSCLKLNNLCLINCKMVTDATFLALISAAKLQPHKKIKYSLIGTQMSNKKRKIPPNLFDNCNNL